MSVECRCDIFLCGKCKNGGQRIERTYTVDSRIVPHNAVTYTESHIECSRSSEVGSWRKEVYDRAWAAVERFEDDNEGKSAQYVRRHTQHIWDDERKEYNDGPCRYFEPLEDAGA